ncbi:DUF6117 family protein [Sphingomonas oryzagri]
MPIPEPYRRNFETLLRAAAGDALALLECRDAETGARRHVLCAVRRQGDDCLMTPFGHLCDGNPYEVYLPPGADAIV